MRQTNIAVKKGENTARLIIEAAEEEFLEKGYAQSKTTDIARKAGVTHAMLHYYFGTKEKLFNKVFESKVHMMAESLLPIVDRDIPFAEKIKIAVETHFDFIAANPRLPYFIFTEMEASAERREICKRAFLPSFRAIAEKLARAIELEVKAGHIAPIHPLDLIQDVIALNLLPFVSHAMVKFMNDTLNGGENFLARRKAENVEVILRRIQK